MKTSTAAASGQMGKAVPLSFTKLHPHFAAEASPVDLRQVAERETLNRIKAALDEYAVLVFHNQSFKEDEQLRFAERLDGQVNRKSKTALILGKKTRLGYEGMVDVSNVNDDGQIWGVGDRKRMTRMGNRFWHTDAAYQDPAGRYSMLWAKAVPPVSAPTEFADMRAAYDALGDEMKETLVGVKALYSAVRNQKLLGFDLGLSDGEMEKMSTAVHPLVRTIPRSNRKSLYLAVHADHLLDWPVPEGRMVLLELIEHATQREFVYRHEWQNGDLVIWDNRATMHRRPPFNDLKYRRELVRVTTLDYPDSPAA